MPSVKKNENKNEKRAHVFLSQLLVEQVDSLKSEFGPRRTDIIGTLLREHFQKPNTEANRFAVATYENLMSDPAPAQIVGLPNEGKSWTLDRFLKEVHQKEIPILLFNSSSGKDLEHSWITNALTFYEAAALRWLDAPSQYRIEFERDFDLRRSAVRELSRALLRLENDARLNDWVVAIEEAHDYCKIDSFLTLLRRMRKSTRKIVIVSTESELFRMCRAYRPYPKVAIKKPS